MDGGGDGGDARGSGVAPCGVDAALLQAAVGEVVAASIGTCRTATAKLDRAVEDHLARVDEVSVLLDSARMEVTNAVDTTYPELMKNTAELQALFAVIDGTEAAVGRAAAAAKSVSDRMDVLQKGYDTKYPEGIAKLASWLGTMQRTAIDAPVALPSWDAAGATVKAGEEVAHIRSHAGALPVPGGVYVGDVSSMLAGSGGLTTSAASAEGGVSDAAPSGVLEVSALQPVAAGESGSGRHAAIATGEDDEEEEEEGDDDE